MIIFLDSPPILRAEIGGGRQITAFPTGKRVCASREGTKHSGIIYSFECRIGLELGFCIALLAIRLLVCATTYVITYCLNTRTRLCLEGCPPWELKVSRSELGGHTLENDLF